MGNVALCARRCQGTLPYRVAKSCAIAMLFMRAWAMYVSNGHSAVTLEGQPACVTDSLAHPCGMLELLCTAMNLDGVLLSRFR